MNLLNAINKFIEYKNERINISSDCIKRINDLNKEIRKSFKTLCLIFSLFIFGLISMIFAKISFLFCSIYFIFFFCTFLYSLYDFKLFTNNNSYIVEFMEGENESNKKEIEFFETIINSQNKNNIVN